MRSAGVMAVWVRAGACLSGNAICALAGEAAAKNALSATKRRTSCMDGLPNKERKGKHPRVRRSTSPFGCELSRRVLGRGWGLVLVARGWGRRGRLAAAPHRAGQDPEPRGLTLPPRPRTIEQDHKHPRQPAHPLTPA